MVDCAKGIKYLHDNGILHRDIKPHNFLITSLDSNVSVNCKLTDFGSARNINLLMTNLSLTKGIGSPKYMAPEILNKDKYKKPADIFSFAITMYEIIGWCDAYSSSKFKYPWDVVEFVMNGNRLEKVDSISDSLFKIIEQCWCGNPIERLKIEDIDVMLEDQLSIVTFLPL